jgi:hypothetical protein
MGIRYCPGGSGEPLRVPKEGDTQSYLLAVVGHRGPFADPRAPFADPRAFTRSIVPKTSQCH